MPLAKGEKQTGFLSEYLLVCPGHTLVSPTVKALHYKSLYLLLTNIQK